MSLDMGRNRLFKEFEVLQLRWEEAQVVWQDVVRQEFTEGHWTPLERAVISTVAAMDRLAPIMAQAQHECAGGREFV